MSRSWVALLVVSVLTGCAEQVSIEVTVRAPSEPKATEQVWLTTDDASVGTDLETSKKSATVFTTTVEIPDGKTVTLGAKLSTGVAALDVDWNVLAVPVTADADSAEPQKVTLEVRHWDVVAPPGTVRTRFLAHVSETSPPQLPEVFLSGPSEALGGGQVRGVPMKRAPDGTFVALVALPEGVAIEYTYNLGNVYSFEVNAAREKVVHSVTPAGTLQQVEDHIARWASQTLTGDIRAHTLEWSAKNTQRRVMVYLPPGYDTETTRRYPVLYMHDGQNLMDALTGSSFGEWGVDETAQQLIGEAKVEPLIIVGVYHGYSERIAEYTHVPSAPYGGGQAEQYRAFLTGVVKPFIDETYRTKPEAAQTGVAGSSLGGLVSMWLGLVEPDVFTRLGVISPSVWWANRDIVTRVTALDAKLPLRIWLDMGTRESSTPDDELSDARALRDALIAEGWTLGVDLQYLEAADATHSEPAWRARFGQILTYLYPAQ